MTAAISAPEKRLTIGKESFAAAILIAAIVFNPLLALVNAHVFPIGRNQVALTEVVVVAAALLLIAASTKRIMLPWLAFLSVFIVFALLLGFSNEYFDPKYARDILIIPIFIMLGMVFYGGNIILILFSLQTMVLVIMLFEMVAPNSFGRTFDVISYYINTREFIIDAFWNPDLELFVSATRPDERFLLGSLNIHRLSSIFLEPVSLGNYCVIMTIVVLAFWQRLHLIQKVFFVATTLVILVGSDGRLASVTCMLLIAGFFAFPRLPRYSNAFYMPFVLVASALATSFLDLKPEGDDFPGRVAWSIAALAELDLPALFGMAQDWSFRVADSGIAYLIVTQSVIVAAAVWLFVSFGLHQRSRAAIFFLHGTCLYISLNLLVSYSLFSIKTAALLWFIYGYLQAEGAATARSRAGLPRPVQATFAK